MSAGVNSQLAATLKALSPVINVAAHSPSTRASPGSEAEMMRRDYPALSLQSIPAKIHNVEYAVRGRVLVRSLELAKDMTHQSFAKLLPCNIGNPHMTGMKPITYVREVLSLLACPTLLTSSDEKLQTLFKLDNIKRARRYYKAFGEPGAYSHSQGNELLREEIAGFFERRDGVRPPASSIFLTNGASDGANTILTSIIGDSRDGVMLSRPQYPLYAASMTRLGGTAVYYDLVEEEGWSLDRETLEKAYAEAETAGVDVKAIVIVAPGNPVPTFLQEKQVKEVLEFAAERRMVVLADEVYQENAYDTQKPFCPFRKVLLENNYPTQLVSIHSGSKGVYGECGFRAGLIQLENVDAATMAVLYKLRSVELCSNTMGQVTMTLATNPPVPGEESYEQWIAERSAILEDLAEKAKIVHEELNSIPGISCQPISGALYAFPLVTFTDKAVRTAAAENQSIELFYCLRLLEQTGIVTTPGCGFGQKAGTHHLRLTILPQKEDLKKALQSYRKFHLDFVAKYC